MGIEFKSRNGYKTIINALIISSGMPFEHAFNLLLDEVETYQIEDFIELITDKVTNKE